MRFVENNVICPKYIDIYAFRGGRGGDGGGTEGIPRSLFVYYSKKMEKVQEHDLY